MIGFDIGGTKCAVTLGEFREDGITVLKKERIPTDLSISPYAMIDRMCSIAENMTDHIDAIGISCGGPLDPKKGVILSPPNLRGWDNVEICDYLVKRYGCGVKLENDANACAVAEWKYGAGRGCDSMIFLTFGTGMGAGIILNGRLYSGACGNAGEVGHIRMRSTGPVGYGKAGSFEGFVSGGGIAQIAKRVAEEALQRGNAASFCLTYEELDSLNAEKVAVAAKAGDPHAIAIYEECGEMLGRGIAILVDILNPERIVIGSIYQRARDLLEPAMTRVLKEECLSDSLRALTVCPAELGEELGDLAALSLAAACIENKGEKL